MTLKKKGRFFVIDGGEGAGKGTVITNLQKWLPEETVFTREPGGTPLAEDIRGFILDPRHSEMEALTEALLFWAARVDHVRKKIGPALVAGKDVVSDRFYTSTYAYQIIASGRSELLDSFESLRRICCGEVEPDLFIILDISPEEGLKRAHNRGDTTRFDEKSLEYHTLVRRGLLESVEQRPHRIVDASCSPEEVSKEVLEIILSV